VTLLEDVCEKKRSIFKLNCYQDTFVGTDGYLRVSPKTT